MTHKYKGREKEYKKQWYIKNSDRIRAERKVRYENDPEKELRRCKEYNEKNQDKISKIHRDYYEAHADKIKVMEKQRRDLDPAKTKEKKRKEYKKNSESYKDYDLQSKFGITLEDYKEMHESQKGVCAICGNPETHILNGKVKRLAVDHDHKNGKIRGLLCASCNLLIGHQKDSVDTLLNMITYLSFHDDEIRVIDK